MIGLTKSQSLCVLIISAISATLSILGSSIIIHKTLSSNGSRKRLGTVYKRILFGMSVMDLFQSIASALTTIPAPVDSLGAYFAYGNTITCNIQGLFATIGYGSRSYNVMLTIHYVVKIRFLKNESQEKKKIEPFMHLVAIGIPLALGIFYLYIDAYNYIGTRCWVGPYPYGCLEDPDTDCTRGANVYLIRYPIGIIIFLDIAIVIINMAVVFWSVRSREKKMQRRLSNSRRRTSLRDSTGSINTFDGLVITDDPPRRRAGQRGSFQDLRESFRDIIAILLGDLNITDEPRRRSSLRRSFQGSINTLDDLNITDSPPTADTAADSSSSVGRPSTISENMEQARRPSAISENMEQDVLRDEYRMSKKTRAVAMQALFHVIAYIISMLPSIILRAVEQHHGLLSFPLTVITALLFPVQGFLNYLVYIRPEVLAIRRRDPSVSLIKAVKMATFTTARNT